MCPPKQNTIEKVKSKKIKNFNCRYKNRYPISVYMYKNVST